VDKQRGVAKPAGKMAINETNKVICLHGMWMPGSEMAYVKMQLENTHNFECRLFSYPSVKSTLDENARLLAAFVAEQTSGSVHLVGHSLGGVLALRMLALNPDAPVARVVCLGSPLCGSRAASTLNVHEWGNPILGKTITAGVVDESASEWASQVSGFTEIGIVAGTVPLGLGRLIANFDGANDGTVAVAETRLPGASDHISLPVNHTGMVVSKDVADQTAAFLKRGQFLREE
jgi:pimeloyl-ACP methyl ester carboxylesterase